MIRTLVLIVSALLGALALAGEDPWLEQASTICADVARLAGEPLEAPPLAGLLDGPGLAALVKRKMEDDPSLPDLPFAENVLKRLGLIPGEMDLRAVTEATLDAQVAGLYDDEDDTLYVVRHAESPSPEERVVIAHESGHLVDDRRWDLTAQRKSLDGTIDDEIVLAVLWEGSATVQMARYGWKAEQAGELDAGGRHALRHWLDPHTDEYDGLPRFFQDRLVAPYLLGQAVVAGGPIGRDVLEAPADPTRARLDAILQRRPVTIAALLHPEQGLGAPVRVDVGPALSALGLRELYQDRLGELMLASALGRPFPQGKAALTLEGWTSPAAAGWRGDQWVTAEREGGERVDLWITAWASDVDRAEFVEAWVKIHPEAPLALVGRRVAVAAWGVGSHDLRTLKRRLARAPWSGGGEGWSP